MSGVEVICAYKRFLREIEDEDDYEEYKAMHIIGLAKNPTEEDLKLALSSGMRYCINKPASDNDLLAAVLVKYEEVKVLNASVRVNEGSLSDKERKPSTVMTLLKKGASMFFSGKLNNRKNSVIPVSVKEIDGEEHVGGSGKNGINVRGNNLEILVESNNEDSIKPNLSTIISLKGMNDVVGLKSEGARKSEKSVQNNEDSILVPNIVKMASIKEI